LPEYDNSRPTPTKKQSRRSKTFDYDYRSNGPKKKKQFNEQCELDETVNEKKIEIVSKINEDASLVKAAKEACKNTDVQKDINHLEEQLSLGNKNPGMGRKPICKGVIEHRAKNGGRLYVRESAGVIEILAKSGKKKSNQQFVINRLKEIYG
jgi:putative component of toxin-antitoxin plasmid stabilization module